MRKLHLHSSIRLHGVMPNKHRDNLTFTGITKLLLYCSTLTNVLLLFTAVAPDSDRLMH